MTGIVMVMTPDNSLGAATRVVLPRVVGRDQVIRLNFLRVQFDTYPSLGGVAFLAGPPGQAVNYLSTEASLRLLSDPSIGAQRAFDEFAVGEQVVLGQDLELVIQLNNGELFGVLFIVGFTGIAPTEAHRKAIAVGQRSYWNPDPS